MHHRCLIVVFSIKFFSVTTRIQTRCYTAQKIKFSIEDFFSKCDQIRSFIRIWSHLLKKSSMENFIFCAVLALISLCNSVSLISIRDHSFSTYAKFFKKTNISYPDTHTYCAFKG